MGRQACSSIQPDLILCYSLYNAKYNNYDTRPINKSAYSKINFISQPRHVVDTQKNSLNGTVLWTGQQMRFVLLFIHIFCLLRKQI